MFVILNNFMTDINHDMVNPFRTFIPNFVGSQRMCSMCLWPNEMSMIIFSEDSHIFNTVLQSVSEMPELDS